MIHAQPPRRSSAIEAGKSPSHRYYRATHGAWQARFAFGITDWALFWTRPLGFFNRLRVLSLVFLSWGLGRPRIATRIDYRRDASEVHHELRICKWGIDFYRSNEVFSLEPDGCTLTIRGCERQWPAMWSAADLGVSAGCVDDQGLTARYTLQWLGGPIQITTQIANEVVEITMDTGWGSGVQSLRPRTRGADSRGAIV